MKETTDDKATLAGAAVILFAVAIALMLNGNPLGLLAIGASIVCARQVSK